MVEPLRKKTKDGQFYGRAKSVELAIDALGTLSTDELVKVAQITDRADPGYVQSEALLNIVRATNRRNSERLFDALFKLLQARVAGQLRGLGRDEQSGVEIAEKAEDRFVDLLVEDRQTYAVRLDFFECRFALAVKMLYRDAARRMLRDHASTRPLSNDADRDISPEVERESQKFAQSIRTKFDDPLYRSRLGQAINGLPVEQKRVVALILKGYPINSEIPGVVSISKLLGCVEKTVRNRRDRAFASIKRELGTEE